MNTTAPQTPTTITDMIRADHAQVKSTLRNYRPDASPDTKQKLVNALSLALEAQTQLKTEFFYPAMRALATDEPALLRSEAEHHQMQSLIGQLRDMRPSASLYDDTVKALTETVNRHVADEEAVLLPQAERFLLPAQLNDLGFKMSTQRMLLKKPSVGKMLLTAGGLLAGGYLIKRALERRV